MSAKHQLGRGWCFASLALLENLTAGRGWCTVECYGQMAPSLQGLQKVARLHPSPAGLLGPSMWLPLIRIMVTPQVTEDSGSGPQEISPPILSSSPTDKYLNRPVTARARARQSIPQGQKTELFSLRLGQCQFNNLTFPDGRTTQRAKHHIKLWAVEGDSLPRAAVVLWATPSASLHPTSCKMSMQCLPSRGP